MPDDKTLIVPQISVNGQLGLPGDLRRGAKQTNAIVRIWICLAELFIHPRWKRKQIGGAESILWDKSGINVKICNCTGIMDQIFT